MSASDFLFPKLTGSRFDDGRIPLEVLKDLAVVEEMLVEVAKAEFLKANPDRRRCPRGFTGGVELKLIRIEAGSAVPVIALPAHATTLFPPENYTYFERARDSVVKAIAAAENNQPITDHLPEKTLSYFDRLGRSLRDDEAIEFTTPEITTPARLTKATRRRLLDSSGMKEVTEETSVRGRVPEADQDNMTFEVQLADNRKLKAPLATQHVDTILDAFNGYKLGTRILLEGVGRFDRRGRLQGFESIEHVSLLDPLDIPSRLEELLTLQDGWLEGHGRAPESAGLIWLSRAFEQHFPDDLNPPHLYPTETGGVRAEWSSPSDELSLEINLEKRVGEWHKLNLETNEDVSRHIELSEAIDWQWLVQQLRDALEPAA